MNRVYGSIRAINWTKFSSKVFNHIEEYTVPQYGDAPDDQLECWTVEQCLECIQRYINRNKNRTNARGPQEALRDMIKIAHYASVAYEKMEAKNVNKPN